MKKYIYLFFFLLLYRNVYAHLEYCSTVFENDTMPSALRAGEIYNSTNGVYLPTQATIRALTIFINIIYDQTPENDPLRESVSPIWPANTNSSINSHPPTYMKKLFDTQLSASDEYEGIVTKFYAEASFNQLIILSDFMVVNIKQSQITPNRARSFNSITLKDTVIAYINNHGGVNTYYNHNNISDYDKITSSSRGLSKLIEADNKIDLINFVYRNTTGNYGGVSKGQGYATNSTFPSTLIKINGQPCGYNTGVEGAVGDSDITTLKSNVFIHEIAHLILGDNSFHTSGGTTNNRNYYNTFIGKQFGYGLFAGNNGLSTANAYERWRLGWRNPSNNAYPIATASNTNSDIEKFQGERIFTLRDFVTYGDAIRIRLPYKDNEESSNQYIWLENHQCGKNNKHDSFIHSTPGTCRDVDGAGIYAYYQIGKDVLESTNSDEIYPQHEQDNLRILSAEGNHNAAYQREMLDCLGWVDRPLFKYTSPNPLQGANNQTEVYTYNTSGSLADYSTYMKHMGAKIKYDETIQNDLPWIGSHHDAFIPEPEIQVDISTNPTPVNVVTYYSVRNSVPTRVISTPRNTRRIYLTGLSVKMIDPEPLNTGMKAYTVKIRWDDYDVKQNVQWAGDIVLKERLNLLQEKVITLEQNLTPNQLEKDPVSDFHAPPTKFTCENGSIIDMALRSQLIIKEKSSFILENGADMIVQDGAEIIVEEGASFIVKSGAFLDIRGKGKLTINEGAYICVQEGATVRLLDYTSVIFLKEGAMKGANPAIFGNASCASTLPITGNGTVVNGALDVYIQNEIITANRYIGGRNIYVGKNVTSTKSEGDVTITDNAHVVFDATGEVVFKEGFESHPGNTFEVAK